MEIFGVEQITDQFMNDELQKAKEYSLAILKSTPKTFASDSARVTWEHGRRNFALRAHGVLSIVCPVTDGSGVAGIGIFDAPVEDVQAIMQADPAVKAGVLGFEVHPVRGFPGDRLPG